MGSKERAMRYSDKNPIRKKNYSDSGKSIGDRVRKGPTFALWLRNV